MTNNNENDNLIRKAAMDVLTLARSILIVKFRFLDIAMGRLELVEDEDAGLATDGARLIYGPVHVLRSFRSDQEKPAHDYLHVMLHCIFSHMFVGTIADRQLWDLACDIAVESTVNDMGLHDEISSRTAAQRAEIERLRSEVNMLTAEKIYHHYRESDISDYELERLSELFAADDHSIWFSSKPDDGDDRDKGTERGGEGRQKKDDKGAGTDDQVPDEDDTPDETEDDDKVRSDPVYISYEDGRDGDESGSGSGEDSGRAELMEEWRNIAEKVQESLETFFREQGDAAGGLMQNLNEVNRERYDYTSFLKKFSVRGEDMIVNDEEFDYIFYTYGLQLYENMPLVEPLEYKEVRKIREFVIAIDTSGSTSGELVQRFLQKTYNILKSTESYFSRINIHIIQCDAVIQEHVKITSEEEFDRYISTMSIHGLGGTDFRPVFDFVDDLIDSGEFSDLRGMIYFTDGFGTFPARKPGYDTAFVFLDNEYNNPSVPLWAIKLVLQDEDI